MSRYGNDGLAALFALGLYGVMVVVGISLALLKLWLIGSLVTSSVKAISHDCGTKYGVESVVSGDWFCPSK